MDEDLKYGNFYRLSECLYEYIKRLSIIIIGYVAVIFAQNNIDGILPVIIYYAYTVFTALSVIIFTSGFIESVYNIFSDKRIKYLTIINNNRLFYLISLIMVISVVIVIVSAYVVAHAYV